MVKPSFPDMTVKALLLMVVVLHSVVEMKGFIVFDKDCRLVILLPNLHFLADRLAIVNAC